MHHRQPTHVSHGHQYSEGLRLGCHFYFSRSFQLYYFNSQLGHISFFFQCRCLSVMLRSVALPRRHSKISGILLSRHLSQAMFSTAVNQRGFPTRTSVIDAFSFCMKSQQGTTGFAEVCRYESSPLKTYSTLAHTEESYQDPYRRS
jgi:hypothetical protein